MTVLVYSEKTEKEVTVGGKSILLKGNLAVDSKERQHFSVSSSVQADEGFDHEPKQITSK